MDSVYIFNEEIEVFDDLGIKHVFDAKSYYYGLLNLACDYLNIKASERNLAYLDSLVKIGSRCFIISIDPV